MINVLSERADSDLIPMYITFLNSAIDLRLNLALTLVLVLIMIACNGQSFRCDSRRALRFNPSVEVVLADFTLVLVAFLAATFFILIVIAVNSLCLLRQVWVVRLLIKEVCGHTQSTIHLPIVLILTIRGFIFVAIFIEVSWRLCSILLLVELHLHPTIRLHLLFNQVISYLVQSLKILFRLINFRLPIRSGLYVTLVNLDRLLFA